MNKFTKTIAGIVAVVAFVAVAATSASAYTYTRSLTVGSTGPDVTALQQELVAKGYLVMPTGVAYGYFGNLTKAAVAAFQTANGISPTAGYFGPITQAKLASMGDSMSGGSTSTVPGCTAGAMFSSTTGEKCDGGSSSSASLAGTDGSIDNVSTLSQYSSEQVGEGENNVKVAGFEVQASNDGDIALKSIKLTFDATGNSGSTHLKDYVDSVSIYQGSTKIGSADVSDFTRDSSNSSLYSKTITVSNSVVRADKTEKFYVSVDAVNNFDSSDISSDSWTVYVNNIRYEDGSGVVSTDSTTGDLGNTGTTIGTNGTAGDGVPMNFVSFSTSANTELKFSTDTSTPEAGVVIVDDTDNTDGVTLLKGKIKVEGTSDVWVDQLPVTLTSTGAGIVGITGSLNLSIDGEDYTESVASSTMNNLATSGLVGTVVFDNLDMTLTAGKTYTFTVSADINDTEAGSFDEGATLTASLTASNRDLVDAENEQGDQLSDSSEKSGTVTGEAQEFRLNGVQLALVSTNTSVTTGTSANDDQGTFTIKFKVKAVGDTVYVSTLADAQLSGVTTGKTTIHADKAGTATVTGVSTVITNVSDTTLTSVGNYEIEDGSEETFEITTLITQGSDLYRAVLGGVSWSTTDERLPANAYTSSLDTFKTSYIALN